jgi:hypothetical protein
MYPALGLVGPIPAQLKKWWQSPGSAVCVRASWPSGFLQPTMASILADHADRMSLGSFFYSVRNAQACEENGGPGAVYRDGTFYMAYSATRFNASGEPYDFRYSRIRYMTRQAREPNKP